MNTTIDFKQILEISKVINESGLKYHSRPDLLHNIEIFTPLFDTDGEFIYSKINEKDQCDIVFKELIVRYMYLRCVLDQGPELIGIHNLLRNITNELYRENIRFLHQPKDFFNNISKIVDLINNILPSLHEDGKRRTGIMGYSLVEQARICPTVTFRWGTPLLVILKLEQNGMGLLDWVNTWSYADQIVKKLKDDKLYGLGKAIGDKASRLFMKNIIHTFKLIKSRSSAWNDNSYQIPIDSNIGRILMRSGIVFYFIPEKDFVEKCCQKQDDGRINLGSNRLRNMHIRESLPEYQDAIRLVQSWNARLRSVSFPVMLNVIVEKLKRQGINSSIGTIDDGMMFIGTSFCSNNLENMMCEECPLGKICMANNQEKELKNTYYCGTGEGIFY